MLREVLTCRRETDNLHDRFAVMVIKVVGHVPTKISTISSLFLRSGTITCEVSGSRQYRARGLMYKVLINCGVIFIGVMLFKNKTPLKITYLLPTEIL